MSEPISAEEIRSIAETDTFAEFGAGTVLALLDEVDRLAEALEAAERERDLIDRAGARWERECKAAEAVIARQLGDCTGCTDEPDECCPRDGRTYTEWVGIASDQIGRANRAEADLADEKRRRAELRALADQYGCACLLDGRPCWGCRLRALLSDATTERCTCDPGPEGQHQLDRCEGFGQPLSDATAGDETALLDTATEETP